MKVQKSLRTWSARQAIAILAVDNIKVSDFGYDVLRRKEQGLLTYEEAKKEILDRARGKVLSSTINKIKM